MADARSPTGDGESTIGPVTRRREARGCPPLLARIGVVAAGAVSAVVLSAPATAARHTPRTFAAETVPAVQGLVFEFAGKRFTTDRHGILRIATRDAHQFERLQSPGALHKSVRLVWGTTADGSVFRLQRWYHGYLHADASARATLQLLVPTQFRFTGPNHSRWPLQAIKQVTLKRHDGSIVSFPGSAFRRPIVLQGTYVAPNGLGDLLIKDAQYRIEAVIIDGSNVVNRAQQSVYPKRDRDVSVRLLFYPLSLKARDRLFSTAIGHGVDLKYPDGHVRYFPFRHGARLDLASLPRGSYVAKVKAPAFSSAAPIALTKEQVTRVAIFSYLDAAVVCGSLILLGMALWWAGHGGAKQVRQRWRERNSVLRSAREGN